MVGMKMKEKWALLSGIKHMHTFRLWNCTYRTLLHTVFNEIRDICTFLCALQSVYIAHIRVERVVTIFPYLFLYAWEKGKM